MIAQLNKTEQKIVNKKKYNISKKQHIARLRAAAIGWFKVGSRLRLDNSRNHVGAVYDSRFPIASDASRPRRRIYIFFLKTQQNSFLVFTYFLFFFSRTFWRTFRHRK